MRSVPVVVDAPDFDDGSGFVDRPEQAFVPELPVEAPDAGVLNQLAGTDEVELDALVVGPGVEYLAGEPGPIVDSDEACATRGFVRVARAPA